IARLGWAARVVRQKCHPEEERPFGRAAPDDLVGLVAIDVGLVARRIPRRAIRPEDAVLVEGVVVIAIRRRIDRAAPFATAGRDLERVPQAVAVEVLA